tara:strand:- start:310 stop:717 length:408 start_codon:yes stop_codon:yes gene_type:complete
MSYSTTANNPIDWFGNDYEYSTPQMGQLNLDFNMYAEDAVGSSDGYSGMGWHYYLDENQGDVRYVYLGFMRYFWDKYNAKDTDPNHVMPSNMKMYRSQVRNRNLNERTTTYTITFTESENSITDTVSSRSIKSES